MTTQGSLGIVILAHAFPEQLGLLVSELRHPHVRCYVHLDARTDRAPFENELLKLGIQGFHWLPRHPTTWAGPGLVDASLEGIAAAVADGCHHVLQISGQDLPVWPIDRIANFFEANAGRSFMEHFSLPDDRWEHGGKLRLECYSYDVFGRRVTHIPKRFHVPQTWKKRILNEVLGLISLFRPRRAFPPYLNPYGGSQWWNLDREAATWVLAFVSEHPDYRRYHQDTAVPDEIFFQSIVMGTDFAGKHDVVNDSLRYMRWTPGAPHPEMISMDEFSELLASNLPFARKFDLATARAFLNWRKHRDDAFGRGVLAHRADSQTAESPLTDEHRSS